MKFRYNRLLCLVILVGLVASLMINVRRHEVEQKNMTVDFAIDYETLLELAEQEGLPPAKVLADAKEAGFTSLAVYERTFKKMNLDPGTVRKRRAGQRGMARDGRARRDCRHRGLCDEP